MIETKDYLIPSRGADRIRLHVASSAGNAACPTIILGNGIGGTMDCMIENLAERFAEQGFRAIAFDYRHFGQSEGEPRQHFDIARQLQDWISVIDHAKDLGGPAGNRVILWGTSFGGSHVLRVAAGRDDIAAVVAQCPNVDLLETVLNTPPIHLVRLIAKGVQDWASRIFGSRPVFIPLIGPPRSSALMTTPDAIEGYPEHAKTSQTWRNEISAGFCLTLFCYRPIKHARRISAPLLICISAHDAIASPAKARAAAEHARAGVSISYDCDHFQLYQQPFAEQCFQDQLRFLANHGLAPAVALVKSA